MVTDYPSGASVQQPQSPPTVQRRVDICLQSLTFSKDMSNEQLALWLRNHPSLSGTNYEEDITKLRGTLPDMVLMLVTIVLVVIFCLDARINGHIFLSLNESRLERFSVSVGFQFAIMNIIEDMVSSGESLYCSITQLIPIM